MQGHRDQGVGQGELTGTDTGAQQVAQYAAFSELPVEFQCPHQLICGKGIFQRADGAMEGRRILLALPTNLVMACRQWQATLEALWPGPWQVLPAGLTDTDGA